METALGQFSQSSPLTVWRLAPVGRGIGFAMVTISLIVAIYYNILMGKETMTHFYNTFEAILKANETITKFSVIFEVILIGIETIRHLSNTFEVILSSIWILFDHE